MHVVLSFDEKIQDDFENMWLEQRNDHKGSVLVLQHSHHLVEVRMAHLNCLLIVIHCNSIKCSLINCTIKLGILIKFGKVRHISDLEAELEVLWLALLHLLNNLLLVIDGLHCEPVDPQVGHKLLRKV